MCDFTGQKWGRFCLDELIGSGGMGQVYRARDERLNRDVAIKVLPDGFATDPERLRRFKREARVAGSLNHRNITTVYDFGVHENRSYLVTELLRGVTLRKLIKTRRIDMSSALEYVEQAAEGLAEAHANGVIHRDLKPENLFVTKDETVKILDFGLAKEIQSDQNEDATATYATAEGVVIGTVGYMAPEQVRGESTDARTDIFALGCVLYEMLSGQHAFRKETAVETMTAILREDPLDGLEISVAQLAGRLLSRCLAKSPTDRFSSAVELLPALREVRDAVSHTDLQIKPRPSIAVLPFANLSAEPEQEYFCDGMAEEIINALAHVDGLRVVARTSSFAFRERNEDIRFIGGQLEVSSVLEGSVRRSGNRLRITANLIDVNDGCHLWSNRFDRQLEDVFAIQDEISLAVVDSLKIALLGDEKAAVVRRFTDNVDLYNLYLEGLHHWHKLTPEGYSRSIECYQRVLEMDPKFAPALVWMGVWYLSQSYWAEVLPFEAIAKAREYVELALAVDSEIADAHTLLGIVQSLFEHNRVAGEESLRQAVRLAPNLTVAHANLAIHLLMSGELDEAVQEARVAYRLDPLSVTNSSWTGSWLVYAGEFEEGISQLRRTIEVHPQEWVAHYHLGDALFVCERLDESLFETDRAVQLSGGLSITVARKSVLLYLMGRVEEADELWKQLELKAGHSYISPTLLALINLARGENDAAMTRFTEAFRCRDAWLAFVPCWIPAFPTLDPLVAAHLEDLCA